MQPMMRDVEMLRNIPLFAGLPTPRLKLIAYTAEVIHFEPGEVIVQPSHRFPRLRCPCCEKPLLPRRLTRLKDPG